MSLEKKEKNERIYLGPTETTKMFCKLNTALEIIEDATYRLTKKDADKLIRACRLISRVITHL